MGPVLKASIPIISPFHCHQGTRKERHNFVLTEVEDEIAVALSHLIDAQAPLKLLNINSRHADITRAHSASDTELLCCFLQRNVEKGINSDFWTIFCVTEPAAQFCLARLHPRLWLSFVPSITSLTGSTSMALQLVLLRYLPSSRKPSLLGKGLTTSFNQSQIIHITERFL